MATAAYRAARLFICAQCGKIDGVLHDPSTIFVDHVQGREFFPGTGNHLVSTARAEGYGKEIVRVIADSNGRPTFELFCFLALVE